MAECCRELLETDRGPLITTPLVIAETGWLLDRQLGPTAEVALYRSIAAGELLIEHLASADWTRIAALTEQYADQHLGGVDASLVAIAERLCLDTIATLDRRHFAVVRQIRLFWVGATLVISNDEVGSATSEVIAGDPAVAGRMDRRSRRGALHHGALVGLGVRCPPGP
ncbi:MAG: PIN domain-containing protein [Solirubrobacteraceae bacterium]|jgi:predicted nucleic acid-binding protein